MKSLIIIRWFVWLRHCLFTLGVNQTQEVAFLFQWFLCCLFPCQDNSYTLSKAGCQDRATRGMIQSFLEENCLEIKSLNMRDERQFELRLMTACLYLMAKIWDQSYCTLWALGTNAGHTTLEWVEVHSHSVRHSLPEVGDAPLGAKIPLTCWKSGSSQVAVGNFLSH